MSSNQAIQKSRRGAAQGLSARRRIYNVGMRTLIYIAAAIVVALLVFLLGYILYRGLPNLTWEFLTSEESVVRDVQGIGPAILNTLYVIIATLVVVLPLGVGSAIYLTEYATNRKLVAAIEFATETLAGIPSIIYALVGVLIFAESLALGKALIAGAFTLVIMTLPTVIRTTQESRVPGPWQRQVAHDPHRGAALLHRRHRHRLHPGHRPDRGRERRSPLHRGHEHADAGLFPERAGELFLRLRFHPERGPLCLRQGAG